MGRLLECSGQLKEFQRIGVPEDLCRQRMRGANAVGGRMDSAPRGERRGLRHCRSSSRLLQRSWMALTDIELALFGELCSGSG